MSIEFLGHSGFVLEHVQTGKRIAIDPFHISNNLKRADIILITHNHYDHCSIEDIEKIASNGAVIICPPNVQSKILKLKNIEMQIVEAGDEISVGNFKIEAFPAYNIGKKYHPKADGFLGFLIKIKNLIVYHAGDTDKIPEMEKLTGYGKHGSQFVAFLPVSGEYVMDAYEAAEVASELNVDVAIPMHYGDIVGTVEDAKKFSQLCTEKNIPARVLEKI